MNTEVALILKGVMQVSIVMHVSIAMQVSIVTHEHNICSSFRCS